MQAGRKLTKGKKIRKNLPHNLCNELNNHQNLTFEDPHYNSLNALCLSSPLSLSLLLMRSPENLSHSLSLSLTLSCYVCIYIVRDWL